MVEERGRVVKSDKANLPPLIYNNDHELKVNRVTMSIEYEDEDDEEEEDKSKLLVEMLKVGDEWKKDGGGNIRKRSVRGTNKN